MKEKSENFNSLRPILFELFKKKLQGGVKLTPPPAGIGLILTILWANHVSCRCGFMSVASSIFSYITMLKVCFHHGITGSRFGEDVNVADRAT